MAISEAQWKAWLNDPAAIRTILVEADASIAGVETTQYLSSRAYVDEVASRVYQPVVVGESVKTTERLSIDGNSLLSFGDIEYDNTNGELDSWLNDVWVNRKKTVLMGDVRWPRADFKIRFSGITRGIDSKDGKVLNSIISDKIESLNAPVSEFKQGGTGGNKDELVPIVMGEPFNISPLMSVPGMLELRVHPQWVKGVLEVNDDGVPVEIIAPPSATGTFNLAVEPVGKVTCTVQGDKQDNITYRNTVGSLVRRLVTGFEDVVSRFTEDDLDTVQLDAFEVANPQPVGIYLKDRINVLSVASQLTSSVGAQIAMSREGLMQLIKIELPAPGTPVTVGINEMMTLNDGSSSLKIIKTLPVQAAQTIGYNKNWTVLPGLKTNIPLNHKEIFAQEWRTVTSKNAAVAAEYKQDGNPKPKETMLLREVEAKAEADRLLELFEVQRFVMSFDGTPAMIDLRLGGPVTLTHPKFNLANGKPGMVIGLLSNLFDLSVTVEVLV